MKSSVLNHVALLVPSVQKAADYLKPFQFSIGPAKEWEGEGTLEIYVGDPSSRLATLLLMEPVFYAGFKGSSCRSMLEPTDSTQPNFA